MGKSPPKPTALVVSAIRKLRDIRGSTSREILNFITTEYDQQGPTERQLQAALKRGVDYGILKLKHGQYSLSTDAAGGSTEMGKERGTMDKFGKKRKYRKCKKTRRCGRGCIPSRRKRRCGKKRSHRRSHGRSRYAKKVKTVDGDNLALNPLDCRDEIGTQRSHRSGRSTRNHSRSRSDHSSVIGDRDTSLERREKLTE